MKTYTNTLNITSLIAGLALLIVGAYYYELPDWNVPVCFTMGLSTYFLAPLSVSMLKQGKVLLPIVFCWISVDLIYVVTNYFVGVDVENLRVVNALASIPMYLIGGVIWNFIGASNYESPRKSLTYQP